MVLLLLAIGTEVGATAALPRTDGFHNPCWTAVVLVGYAVSIWLLAIVVATMPGLGGLRRSGPASAPPRSPWSASSLLGESWDLTKAAALTLIVVGVVVLNLHGAH